MNTVASQVTLFTDRTVEMVGPVRPGPTLYEWAKQLAENSSDADDPVISEVRALGPDNYPTRALYGRYLEWVYARVVATAPEQLSVTVHATTAIALNGAEPTDLQSLLLDDGTQLDDLDAVVLAQGHLNTALDAEEVELDRFAARHGLTYLAPANPADLDLSRLRPGRPVLIRGLGLNFFDHLSLLTAGRGGWFESTAAGLVYHPSGREPLIYAGSRRGVPYHSRGENEKGPYGRHIPQYLTLELLAALRELAASAGGLDFRRDLWPLVAAEVELVYYRALLVARDNTPDQLRRFTVGHRALAGRDPSAADAELAALLDEFEVEPASRWRWDLMELPYLGQSFSSHRQFQNWLLRHLRADVRHASAGNVRDPVKAALDVLRDLRNEIRLIVDHGGLCGDSYRDHLDRWYTPLNAYLSIGPPAGRIEEMIALIKAGVLRPIPP